MTRTTTQPVHNPPAHRVRLIGREQDLAVARQSLLAAEGRLLTLTGTGGCGKTRLALELASDLLPTFADGVWLVELGAIADPVLRQPTAIAGAAAVRDGQHDRSNDYSADGFGGRRNLADRFHHPAGDQDLALVIETSNGGISGSVTNPALGITVPIAEGRVDSNRFSFKAPMKNPVKMEIGYDGIVDRDAISGEITIQGGGTFPFAGTRV